MIKKIYLASAISLFSINSFALDFLGQKLEDTQRSVIENLIKTNSGQLIKKTPLTTTYKLSGKATGDIPYAIWAKVYYSPDEKFVGLNIGFPYDKTSYINIRRALYEKYGKPQKLGSFTNVSDFKNDFFSGSVIWKFPNKTSIEYNQDRPPEPDELGNHMSNTYMSIFYRHDARKEELQNALKEQHYKSEEKKIKSVF